MFGNLSNEEIEQVLQHQVYGHLGCYSAESIYVVPISYAYNNGYIYGHSRKGLKTDLMQKKPKVCFNVVQMENMANWRSVIMWGNYEELKTDKEREQGIHILLQRHAPHIPSKTLHLSAEWPFTPEHLEKIGGIIFRIRITKKTGRFENSSSEGVNLVHTQ